MRLYDMGNGCPSVAAYICNTTVSHGHQGQNLSHSPYLLIVYTTVSMMHGTHVYIVINQTHNSYIIAWGEGGGGVAYLLGFTMLYHINPYAAAC